jgi:F0F1-type ATP synthase delta subunit
MKQAYITAFVDMILAGTPVENVIANTKALLEKKGHQRLFGAIVRGAKRELEYKIKAQSPKIVLAKNDEAVLSAAKAALATLGVTAEVVVSIDETLIGGFITKAKYQIIDSSYKRALLDMYRKVTK